MGDMLGWLVLLGVITAVVTYVFYVAVERLGVGPGITIQYLGTDPDVDVEEVSFRDCWCRPPAGWERWGRCSALV